MHTIHNRTTRLASKPRRGATLLVAVVVLVMLTAISTELFHSVVVGRDIGVKAHERRQAEFLAEAGLRRAAAQLQISAAYTGEVWEIAAKDLGSIPARVEIRVQADPSKTKAKQVTVTADYPRDLPQRNRIQKTISIAASAR